VIVGVMRVVRNAGGAGSDDGSGSVLVLALGAALVVAMVGVASAGQVVAARHAAEAAADMSALAAASTVVLAGPGAACARATVVATAQATQLDECVVAPDLTVRVVVVKSLPGALANLGLGPVQGRARAGPAEG
jgi:secretion/DNA translocation related TadE-like protein